MSGPLSPQEERDIERMDREDAMVANYDEAEPKTGEFEPEDDDPPYDPRDDE